MIPGGIDGLRVLALCDHLPFESSGGAERVAWEVYRRIAARGASVTLLAATAERFERTAEIDGIRTIAVPAIRLDRWLNAEVTVAPRLFRRVDSEARRVGANVLHANGLHFQSSLAAAVTQRRRSTPMVTTVHVAGLDLLPRALRTATNAYEQTAGRFILRRSVRAIAVSASVAAHVRSLGMPADRVVVVPNGVDHDRFAPSRRDAPTVPHVAMVGRLIGNKGPDLFLEALGRLRDEGVGFTAAFVGDGPMRGQLEGRARLLGLADVLSFTGHVRDVDAELRRTDVLVRPSLTEGMPLAVLEAMASGVCVVAAAVPGTTDIINDGVNGLLFPPASLPGLIDALRRVLSSRNERTRLATAGHEASLSYSWDTSADATASVLAEVASPASAPA